MISEFFFISCKSNKRNSSVLYEFTDKWPGLLWKHLALKRLSADFCHYKLWLLHLYTWRCEELTRLTCRMPRRCVLLKLSFFGCAISGCALTFAGINLLVYLDFPSLICLNEINGHSCGQIYPKLELSLLGIPANRAHPKQDSTNSNNWLNNTI